jgi:hypothetical protein
MKPGQWITQRPWLAAAVALAIVASDGPVAGEESAWRVGDVFLAVGDGTYHVFDRAGRFKEAIEDELGGYTTDCGFAPSLDKLYTLNYTRSKVVVYDDDGEHAILQTIDPRETSPDGHSGAIVFAADGGFYVGHPDGDRRVHKYDEAGMLLATYRVQTEGRRGTNWIDLSADQQTLFYTSAGRVIQRFDTGSNTQLSDFAELPGEGHAEAIRLLPPGDGSGGLLVADGAHIKRLDATGDVIQRYDAPERDSWFAINLDPDGQSFWATDQETDQVARFDLDTGSLRQSFAAGPGETVFGVCVKGELTAGVPQAQTTLPLAYEISQNVPNPFNPSTEISYRLPEPGTVRLEIYNLVGQRIHTLVQEEQRAGAYTVMWDGRDGSGLEVSSGVYLYRFSAGNLAETRRMLLLK